MQTEEVLHEGTLVVALPSFGDAPIQGVTLSLLPFCRVLEPLSSCTIGSLRRIAAFIFVEFELRAPGVFVNVGKSSSTGLRNRSNWDKTPEGNRIPCFHQVCCGPCHSVI
jgi:hypothetical protein